MAEQLALVYDPPGYAAFVGLRHHSPQAALRLKTAADLGTTWRELRRGLVRMKAPAETLALMKEALRFCREHPEAAQEQLVRYNIAPYARGRL